jgi:hypothetical protein
MLTINNSFLCSHSLSESFSTPLYIYLALILYLGKVFIYSNPLIICKIFLFLFLSFASYPAGKPHVYVLFVVLKAVN